MNQATAQSVVVLIFGLGLWLFLLEFVYTTLGLIGVTLLVFGLITIISRILPEPSSQEN